jgi:hypothetical protein
LFYWYDRLLDLHPIPHLCSPMAHHDVASIGKAGLAALLREEMTVLPGKKTRAGCVAPQAGGADKH